MKGEIYTYEVPDGMNGRGSSRRGCCVRADMGGQLFSMRWFLLRSIEGTRFSEQDTGRYNQLKGEY